MIGNIKSLNSVRKGVDGALIRNNSDEIYHVNFIERYWQQFWQRCQTLFLKEESG
jgi:hypothetical protein